MARTSGKKDDLIKCEYCGEMYSTTYKHCPFCNEDGTGAWDEPEEDYEPIRPAGGKRLAGGGATGGGYYDPPPQRGNNRGRRNISPWSVLGVILSLVLIIAAICIVVSIFRSITGRGPKPKPTPTPPPVESVEPTPAPTPTDPAESEVPTPTPTVEVTVPPAPNAPTDFRLNATDLTFDAPGQTYNMRVIFTPADASAGITWTSSDPEVASVSWNGKVTAISRGTVNITATVEGLGEKSCIFRCNFDGTASSSSGTGTSSSGGISLSNDDFTVYVGETWRIKVSGTESEVTWTSSNESVATVSSNGTVKGVGKGTCTVTAEVDGVKLKCIVRCNGLTKQN